MVVAKKKKKRSTPVFPSLVFHYRGLTVLFKFFSAVAVIFSAILEIKDNSNLIKDKGQGVQIKDCPLK